MCLTVWDPDTSKTRLPSKIWDTAPQKKKKTILKIASIQICTDTSTAFVLNMTYCLNIKFKDKIFLNWTASSY
jgi:hypothetical protein